MPLPQSKADFIDRACPSCGAAASERPAVSSKRPAENLSIEELADYWVHFFKEKVFFSYHRCARCGQLFCSRFFSERKLSALYSHMGDNTLGVSLEPLRETQRRYFSALGPLEFPEGDYLELGPDIGLFTEHAAKDRRLKKFWLIEPNRATHEALRALMRGREHEVLTELPQIEAARDQSISVAVLIHVLDHLIDPQAALDKIRRKMKPGGLFLIVTHDEGSVLARTLGRRWPPYCLQHPQLYRRSSMRSFLESRCGLKVVDIRKSVNCFPAPYLAEHLIYATVGKRVKLPMRTKLTLPLKLGNILTIARN